MKDINGQTSNEILEQRKKEGIIKEFPLTCSNFTLRVKMPAPKVVDEYLKSFIVGKDINDKQEMKITAQEGWEIQEYYLGLFESGLLDGWTLDLLKPEEYAEVKEGVSNFFGQTSKKDGTNSPITPSGQTDSTNSLPK
jgi:hypothetical protein